MIQFTFLLLVSGFVLGFSFTIGRNFFQSQRLRQLGMSSNHEFVKYQGLGNDFILVDNLESSHLKYTADQSVRLCDRNFGIGGDGVIFALPGQNGCDYTMRIYNSDGSEPQMCGNGIRCLAKFLHLLETMKGKEQKKIYRIWTNAGVIVPRLTDDGLVTVDMGEPILSPNNKIPTTLPPTKDGRVVDAEIVGLGRTYYTTAVSMGNPHSVIYVGNLDTMDGGADFPVIGPVMEKHPSFPERVNTEFVQVLNRNHVRVKVWERGAGPTLACGTGACAVAVAGVLTGRTERDCKVTLPGGDLFIEWKEADNHIYMTGPAEPVFQGSVTMAL